MARLGAGGGLKLERPQAYLSRMAANLLRDEGRRASRQMSGNHVPADESLIAAPDQQRLLESRDMLTRVEAAMLKLRPRTREIFMAHRIDGLSYAEIAERTGLTVKGVEKQMSKAIAKIDRLLDRG
jgi:RNA polymerase sigma-70 factor (ECF subfamily)